jgi:WD40 repeat protein
LQVFVGRQQELSWLSTLLDRATHVDHPVVAVLTGARRSGKTSLLREFGQRAYARGAEVVSFDGRRNGSAAALQAALAAAERGTTPRVLLLDDVDLDGAGDCSLLDRLADLRLGAPVLVACTGEDVDGQNPRFSMRALTGLSRAEVGELLVSTSGVERPVDVVDSVFAETAGLPGPIAEIGRRFREMDIAARADRALARAETARAAWAEVRTDVAAGVLARARSTRTDDQPQPDTGTCPYKGLASFAAADAAFFAGRERLVAELVARLAVDHFLAIVGASGSGKSSLVAAGLLPALASGALPGSETWVCRVIRPGATPVRTLAAALAASLDEPFDIEDVLTRALDALRAGSRLVVVVDQFEETFTACADPVERTAFIDALVRDPSEHRLVVAVVLRADHYEACAAHPELARLLGHHQILVSAMTDAELARAVTEPAYRVGLSVEDALTHRVIEDAGGAPGALPLLSTALLQTWVRRSNATLTLAGYQESGGVRGAVGQLAEGVYESLDPQRQAMARRILLRLADPDSERTDVRRRAQRDELAGTDAEREVLDELIDKRLLTASENTVEVAHEALLREWPRLRSWLEEDRDGRRVHRRLADAAVAWDAGQRDDSDLYRGVRLNAAQEWAVAHPGDANRLESEFLAASDAAEARALHEARAKTRRFRLLAAALAVLLVLAGVVGVIANAQRSQARQQKAFARARTLQADVSRLTDAARALPANQRDVALLLAAQAYEMERSDETVGGLQAAVEQTPPGLERIIRYPSTTWLPHLDHTGRLMAVADTTGAVIYNLRTSLIAQTMHWPRPLNFAVFSGDDSLVAAGGNDGEIAIWDAATGRVSGVPLHVGGTISVAMFNPVNRNRIYAVSLADTEQLTTWDRSDPQHPHRISTWSFRQTTRYSGAPGALMTVSPDGRLVAAGDIWGNSTTVWDLTTGKQLHTLPGAPGIFAADSRTLPIGNWTDTILYDARTGRQITTIRKTYATSGGLLSADGRRLAATNELATTAHDPQIYDVRTGRAITAPLRLHNGGWPVAFLSDSRLLTTGNNEAAIWTLGRTLPPLAVAMSAPPVTDPNSNYTVFLPRSNQVITVSTQDGTMTRDDERTGAALGVLPTDTIEAPIAPSPDGKLIAAGDISTEQVGIWRADLGRPLATLPNSTVGKLLAWSPDGRQLVLDDGDRLQFWNTADLSRPRLIASISYKDPLNLRSVDFRGHTVLLTDSETSTIIVVNATSHAIAWTRKLADREIQEATLSPDGTTIAVNSGDVNQGRITLYRTASGKQIASAALQSTGAIGYLHGGAWLVVTAGIVTPVAQIYDAHTLAPIGIPFPIVGNVETPLGVDQAGTMFSEAEDTSPRVWDVDPAHWQRLACQIAARNLTRAEWTQYLPNRPYQRTCPQDPPGH